jgi:hypothetical protein
MQRKESPVGGWPAAEGEGSRMPYATTAIDIDGIGMSASLVASLERARALAGSQGHAAVGLEHLLIALTEDADAKGSLLACRVDTARLRADVERHLTGEGAARGGEAGGRPPFSAELEATLGHAAAASREAGRREINSFIVLAAIVGQEGSAAARILESHGFTFEEALRALKARSGTRADEARPAPAALPPPAAAPEPQVDSEQDSGASADAAVMVPPAKSKGTAADGRSADGKASAVRVPAKSAPSLARPGGAAKPPPQSVDDIMASVREMMGTPRGELPKSASTAKLPARARPREIPLAVPSPSSPPVAARSEPPSPEPSRAGETGPILAPWPEPPAAAPEAKPIVPESEAIDVFDLGAPLPEERIGAALPPQQAPPPPGLESAGRNVLARRREPAFGPPPPLPSPAANGRVGPAAADHEFAGAPYPSLEDLHPSHESHRAPPPQPASPPTTRRPAIEPGKLVEAVPREMRVAIPETVEVRIARRDVEGLSSGIAGGGPARQHEIFVTSAMSVRLRAPDGGFAIDPASPETQWIENSLGLVSQGEFASWRWTVTPLERGRNRLQLVVSARTVGPDGVAAETALPDQTIEVDVRTNYARSARRWAGWGLAAIFGAGLQLLGDRLLAGSLLAPIKAMLGL